MPAVDHRQLDPQDEYQETTIATWRDALAFWRDRRLVLNKPEVVSDASYSKNLRLSPFTFAVLALMLPELSLASLHAGVAWFVELPPPSVESVLSDQKNLQTILDDAAKSLLGTLDGDLPPTKEEREYPALASLSDRDLEIRFKRLLFRSHKIHERGNLSEVRRQRHIEIVSEATSIIAIQGTRAMRGLRGPLGAAREETRQNRLFLLTIQKATQLEEALRPLLLPGAVLLNAYAFGLSLGRRTARPVRERAVRAFLYIVSASVFFPIVLLAILGECADLASRYQATSYLEWHNALTLGSQFLLFAAYWPAAGRLARALPSNPSSSPGTLRRRLSLLARLAICQVVAGAALQLTFAFVGIPLVYVAVHWQG